MTKSLGSSEYLTTRPFPESIASRAFDLVPPFCRSVRVVLVEGHPELSAITAHKSEIGAARKAVRIAKREAETAHIK